MTLGTSWDYNSYFKKEGITNQVNLLQGNSLNLSRYWRNMIMISTGDRKLLELKYVYFFRKYFFHEIGQSQEAHNCDYNEYMYKNLAILTWKTPF